MVNDELLGAYLDGELDEEKRALVEYFIATDPGAAARCERLRKGDALLRRAIPRVATDADDPIATMIRTGRPVISVRRFLSSSPVRRVGALAAACVVGAFVGNAMLPGAAPSHEVAGPYVSLSADIGRFLDRARSGDTGAIEGGQIQAALTVAASGGVLCREFRMTGPLRAVDALACREQGGWQVVVQALAAPENLEYRVASQQAATPIEAAIEAMDGAQVMTDEQERELIQSGWDQ